VSQVGTQDLSMVVLWGIMEI